MTDYRTETDFLGERQIPKDMYYGINAMRSHENFNINDDKIDGDFIKVIAQVKKACAMANSECGALAKDTAGAIIAACDKITGGNDYDGYFIGNPLQGGGGTSLNMTANEVIANIALEILGHKKGEYNIINPLNHVNMSQSTNDVFPAAVNLTLILKSARLLSALDALKETMLEKSRETDGILKKGRTHLNTASPISHGQCFDAYAAVLSRDCGRIKHAADALRVVPLGGTVIGTGLNTTPEYRERVIKSLRLVSGIDIEACLNLADGIQNTDNYSSFSSALKTCMLNLSKTASDLRLMGSDIFGGLILPPMQLGSSIISGKVNPVMPELINNVSFMVCGYDLTVSMASMAGQLELNAYKPIISYCLFRAADMMTEAVSLFDKLCVKNIKI